MNTTRFHRSFVVKCQSTLMVYVGVLKKNTSKIEFKIEQK